MTTLDQETGLVPTERRTQFAFAGKAVFTLRSVATGTHYTYRLKAADNGQLFFASALSGGGYLYLGIVPTDSPNTLRTTKNSRFESNDPRSVALRWFLANPSSERVEMFHDGRCCRCGRKLTTPESVQSGIGPECAKRIGVAA